MKSLLLKIAILLLLQARILSPLECQAISVPEDTASTDAPSWDLSTSFYFYYLPDKDFFGMPIFYADHDRLHLEARYNYEDFRSLSFFAGRTFGIGEGVHLDVIPMLGGVVGNTSGIIPALEMDLVYRNLELYTEAEYVFDLQDSQWNFFYNWAEVSYYPLDWLQLGITSQQTREKETDWLVEYGLLGGFTYTDYSAVVYFFNPGGEDPFYILSCVINF